VLIGSGLYDDVEKEVGEPTSKLRRRLLFFFAEPLLILIGCIEYPNIYLHPSYIAGCPLEIPPLSNLSASYPHRVSSLKKKKENCRVSLNSEPCVRKQQHSPSSSFCATGRGHWRDGISSGSAIPNAQWTVRYRPPLSP
jgi:hypothetical protein